MGDNRGHHVGQVLSFTKKRQPLPCLQSFLLTLQSNIIRMKKWANTLLDLAVRLRYQIVIVLGILLVCFIDENSIMKRIEYKFQISDLNDEIDKYERIYERNSSQLRELKQHPEAISKIARERYFMKADDEDIFVLSDDPKPETNTDNTDETVN